MNLHAVFISNVKAGKNIGSRNQALGVVQSLARIHPHVAIAEYDLDAISALRERLSRNAHGPRTTLAIIAVGADGVDALTQLPPHPKCVSILLGHEVPAGFYSMPLKPNLLAIPEHVTDYQKAFGVECVRTHGVAHAVTKATCRAALAHWRDKLAGRANQPTIVVMLGGQVDGNDCHPREAYLLGRYAVKKANESNARILATSSPWASPEAIHALTAALAKSDCITAFFPCTASLDDNPYYAMLGLVAENSESTAIVTSDSVSMPCEAASVVAPKQLTICAMSNENQQNRNFVEWMHFNGRAKIVSASPASHRLNVRPTIEAAHPAPLDAAATIAEAIGKFLRRTGPSGKSFRE